MRERDPLLAVARIKQKKETNSEILAFVFIPNLVECPPRREYAKKTDHQSKDLPDKGNGRNDACCQYKYGGDKRSEGCEGRDKLSGTKEVADPGECPIIPVETDPGSEKTIGDNGEQCK